MPDEAIVDRLTRLTQIKGTGFRHVYRKRKLPKPEQIMEHGERWKPYRTTAAWYLWRAVDLRNGKPPP